MFIFPLLWRARLGVIYVCNKILAIHHHYYLLLHFSSCLSSFSVADASEPDSNVGL